MNTLKSLMVVGVLGIIGYAVYVKLNDSPPPPMPDYLKAEAMSATGPPSVQLGSGASQTEGVPPVGESTFRSPTPTASGEAPAFGAGSSPPPTRGAAVSQPSNFGTPGSAPPSYPVTSAPAGYTGPAALAPQRPVDASATPPAGAGAASSYGGSTYGNRTAMPGESRSVTAVDSYRRPAPGSLAAAAGPASSSATDAGSRYTSSLPNAVRGPAPGPGPAAASPATGQGSAAFDATMAAAQGELDRGQLDKALLTLSTQYDDPRLSDRQNEQLCRLLDQVAGTVIYSRKYEVLQPHRVAPGERIEDIAQRYSVSPGLLAKINGLGNRPELKPGQELKVLRGPFKAVVNMQKRTLSVMVDGCYAGRFPISVGPENANLEGQFVVSGTTPVHSRYDGQRYIELRSNAPNGNQPATLAIIGTSDAGAVEQGRSRGQIGVNARHADDLCDILSQGSTVTIHR